MPPGGMGGPGGLPDPSHLMHSLPGGPLDRSPMPRFFDNPGAPYNMGRPSPADLSRPHGGFSPAGFPPRGTPTSLPNNMPGFPGPGSYPGMPGMPNIELLLQQYNLFNQANNLREQEERERERERDRERERRDQELRRFSNPGSGLDFELQRQILAVQHQFANGPGGPGSGNAGGAGGIGNTGSGGAGSGGGGGGGPNIPPPNILNPGGPSPANLSGLMFPPPPSDRDMFNDRLPPQDRFNLDALMRLQMGAPDLRSAHAALAALGHFNGPHDGPGGLPPGLGMPPPHSQADSINTGPPNLGLPPGFPGGPNVRPMLSGRDFLGLPAGFNEQQAQALNQMNLQDQQQRQADLARQYYNNY